MNFLIIDYLYRQDLDCPTKWFQKLISKKKFANLHIISFSKKDYFTGKNFVNLRGKINPSSERYHQDIYADYLVGKSSIHEKVLSQVKEYLRNKEVNKIIIFGNNYLLRTKIEKMGYECLMLELGPKRSPEENYILFKSKKELSSFSYPKEKSFYTKNTNSTDRCNFIIPLQLAYDSSFYPESNFSTMTDFFAHFKKIIKDSKNNFYLKKHPGISTDRIAKSDHSHAFSEVKTLENAKKYSLFRKYDATITICSSNALINLDKDIPYFHFHDSILGKGITIDFLTNILKENVCLDNLLTLQKKSYDIHRAKFLTRKDLFKFMSC